MKFIKKYRVRLLNILNKFIIFNNFSISYFFSRFGNNLQQIAIGIIYSGTKNGNFYLKKFPYIRDFSLINNKFHDSFSFLKKSFRFFYFHENPDFPTRRSFEKIVYKNIENVFKKEIAPRLEFLEELQISVDTLVIHIRSGDIFELPISSYYQNPINYYLQIIEKYSDVLIVTSEELNNPVCNELLNIDKVRIQTSTMENDFNTLSSAKNLATSGVGTFPIAAALVSKNLKNFYYTNLFSTEHLNPDMIINTQVIHHKYLIDKSFKQIYKNTQDFENLLLDKSIEIKKELN